VGNAICSSCDSPAVANRARCASCLRKQAASQSRLKSRRRSRSLCQCGNSLAEGKTYCAGCLVAAVGRAIGKQNERRAAGLCYSCGAAPVPGRKQCRKCLDYWNERAKKHFRERRVRIIEHYGGRCACCGIAEIEFLGIDHIHGGGRRKRNADGTVGSQLYNWIVKQGFPADMFQILCHNCNCGRYQNGGVCPHQQKDAVGIGPTAFDNSQTL
jgi:hypothetical protein